MAELIDQLPTALIGGIIGWTLRGILPSLIAEIYTLWKQRHGEAA